VLLFVGDYRWLDRVIKVVVVLFTLSTVAATALVLPRVDWSTIRLLPSAGLFSDPAFVLFMVALVGWMPSAFDLSIWHLWIPRRQGEIRCHGRRSALDFNIGHLERRSWR
jgi:Mn2+/Fe2+ NRAMP family transporter